MMRFSLQSIALAYALVLAPVAALTARGARVTTVQPATATVSGVVYDSIARAPLAGAIVQLVGADTLAQFGKTAVSDSLGQFAFDSVPNGRFTLGFFHPMLDSLGIEPLLRGVAVESARSVRADLAIPAAAFLRASICGAPTPENAGGVVLGVIRDAKTGAPLTGAKVSGEWTEVSIGRTGIAHRSPRKITTTRENGWFAICQVPSPGSVMLMASRGADSTDLVEVEVPADGLLRRELFLGTARAIVMRDSAPRDSATRVGAPRDSAPTRRMFVGDGMLRGTVVAANTNRPLGGAQVSIAHGPTTRANERGEWVLADAPTGTRTLEIRAVGYYPDKQTVDVIQSAPPLRTSLVTFKSVLDTMKVIANYDRYTNLEGFRTRGRTGLGRFITSADIARRKPVFTSDLFRNIPGVYLEGASDPSSRILMRGIFSDRCEPAVYVNGALLTGISSTDLDQFVRPQDIVGVEVYTETQAPPQFRPGLSDCGSIVFWTK
jgi:hypothetical protein